MANWKRYYKDKVEVNGMLVEVTSEVASFINRANWKEEYQERKKRDPVKGKNADGETRDFDPLASSRECSLDVMMDFGVERFFADTGKESLEDTVVDRLTEDIRTEILLDIIPGLSGEEKRMLSSITEGISSRQYEKMYWIPRRTMEVRRGRLLEDLRRRIEAEEKRGDTLLRRGNGRGDIRALLAGGCRVS